MSPLSELSTHLEPLNMYSTEGRSWHGVTKGGDRNGAAEGGGDGKFELEEAEVAT